MTSRETEAERDDVVANYTSYSVVHAEGERIIGMMTCLRCGAAVLINDADGAAIHDRWHIRDADIARMAHLAYRCIP
jgi:hypothetical protein